MGVEEHSNTNRTPYLFNGKELDEETGLYYYGVRYYDAKIGMFLGVDPMAEKREWLSPYNFVQNNPVVRIDPDGALDRYYNENGDFLYEDNKTSDNIKILKQSDFNEIKFILGEETLNDRTQTNLALQNDLDDRSVGINDAGLKSSVASKIFTHILSQTQGVDMSKLYNGKVSIYNENNTSENYNNPEIANGTANAAIYGKTRFSGKAENDVIKITVAWRGRRNNDLGTVSNVMNALGAHEFIGHGVLNFGIGGKPHSGAYIYQMNHSTWENTTPNFKRDYIELFNYYLNIGN
ncbi:RHS repeat-associated core domain-containing protein [Marinigracilibium pacificum]|uniref:RHS repeat-associated core domain-containing protein n=1 Tax=Marinigracilibium pacificum TaxID=2729599 RepID=UPI002FDFB436